MLLCLGELFSKAMSRMVEHVGLEPYDPISKAEARAHSKQFGYNYVWIIGPNTLLKLQKIFTFN